MDQIQYLTEKRAEYMDAGDGARLREVERELMEMAYLMPLVKEIDAAICSAVLTAAVAA